jgi:hypothetical protein
METLTELLGRPCGEIEAHWTDSGDASHPQLQTARVRSVPLWIRSGHLGSGCATTAGKGSGTNFSIADAAGYAFDNFLPPLPCSVALPDPGDLHNQSLASTSPTTFVSVSARTSKTSPRSSSAPADTHGHSRADHQDPRRSRNQQVASGQRYRLPKLIVRVRACSPAYGTYVEFSAAIDRGHERHRRSQYKDQPEPWRSVKPPVEPELRR